MAKKIPIEDLDRKNEPQLLAETLNCKNLLLHVEVNLKN